MEHFYHTIEGWFDFEEIYSQMVAAAPHNAHFVEVGAFLGKSTSFMAVELSNCKKNIRFDIIDTWEGSAEHQVGADSENPSVVQRTLYDNFKRNMKPVAHLINPVQTTSLKAAQNYMDSSLDFVFIDASHDYENVRADIRAWRPKVKPGGFIGGHDFHDLFPGVIQAVGEETPDFEIVGFSWLSQIK